MSRLTAGFRTAYGAGALHLLIMMAGLILLGYLIITAGPSTLWKPQGSWWQSMALWFAAAVIVHELVLFPVYSLADRLLGGAVARVGIPVRNYLRVPMLGSGLILLVFLPDITERGAGTYFADTGLTQQPFLGRWLMLTAVMFAASGLSYAIRAVGRGTSTSGAEEVGSSDDP